MAGDWRARHLARHLAAQDRLAGIPAFMARRLVAATGVRLSEAYRERPRVLALVDGPPRAWNWCLDRLDRAPPAAVLRRHVAPITLWEHVVHHEDVRRPNNVPRRSWPDLSAVVPWLLAYNRSRLAGTALLLVAEDGRRWSVGNGTPVTVRGEAAELVLWLSGRVTYTEVAVSGDSATIETLAESLAI
jgi:uncharacterized protein (TIGR03083 family)